MKPLLATVALAAAIALSGCDSVVAESATALDANSVVCSVPGNISVQTDPGRGLRLHYTNQQPPGGTGFVVIQRRINGGNWSTATSRGPGGDGAQSFLDQIGYKVVASSSTNIQYRVSENCTQQIEFGTSTITGLPANGSAVTPVQQTSILYDM